MGNLKSKLLKGFDCLCPLLCHSADAFPETCLSLMLMQIEAKIAPSTPDSSEINGMAMGEASLVTQKSIRHKLILSKDSSGRILFSINLTSNTS